MGMECLQGTCFLLSPLGPVIRFLEKRCSLLFPWALTGQEKGSEQECCVPIVLSIYGLHSKVRDRELAKLFGSGGLPLPPRDFEERHCIHHDS